MINTQLIENECFDMFESMQEYFNISDEEALSMIHSNDELLIPFTNYIIERIIVSVINKEALKHLDKISKNLDKL